jgi:hypothetical protein
MTVDYQEFLRKKSQLTGEYGFAPLYLPDCLLDFQRHLTEWAIRLGRAAIFADCGLGKTLMQLVWADNVVRHTNQSVLILTPLAVAQQTVREGEKFGIEAVRSVAGERPPGARIVVTNYERLHHVDAADYVGCVCDESSILKNFKGKTKADVTELMRQMKFRLLCTATAAPNDYIELGTSSEALGSLGYMDMLGMFFKNDQGSLHPMSAAGRYKDSFAGGKWRFKSHAERPFWQWLCSWARACRKPSDLGFPDERFTLPDLLVRQHVVGASRPLDGHLFVTEAKGLAEQRQERKHTIRERCERMAELLTTDEAAIGWCHLNPEGDLLTKLIPGAVQVSGKDSDELKEERFLAFERGEIRCLITKPTIAGFGLNWQHCAHMGFFPSHSFEQYYQGVRRCYRFGQKRPVRADIVTSEGESGVMRNLERKATAAEKMFEMLVSEMNNELRVRVGRDYPNPVEVPQWL